MERRGNYFMPNNGQIGFSPLHMLGLSAIHPKSMQQGFVDVSVNTHTVDNNFSLFKCKDQDTEIGNMKNNFMNPFGCGLPVGNSFSKFIGGFIGSKCLIGSSTGRENNFWGRVLQQYNSIIGTNNNVYLSMSAMNSKENAREYINAGVFDAALLFSHSLDLFNTNNLISEEQAMDATKSVLSQESPASSVEAQAQERVTAEPKQSYAEVTKSRAAVKSPCSVASDSKRMRSVRRNPMKLRQKKQSSDISSNNNRRYRTHHGDSGKYIDNTDYGREPRRKNAPVSRGNQQKSVPSTNSIKGTSTSCKSENQEMNRLRTKGVQHSSSRPNRKLPGKRKLNSNLISDIKEDCLGVVDDFMPCEKKMPINHKFNHSPTKKWVTPTDQKSPSNRCTNWRCRPYSLCDPCKMKDTYGNNATDRYGPHTQCKAVTFQVEQKENDKENIPETPGTPVSLENPDDTSPVSVPCSDSPLTKCEMFLSKRCPVLRTRISSECSVDSEDSFVIMFDASGDDSYEETSETDSVCSDSDSSDDDDDDDDDGDTSSIDSQSLTYVEHSDDHDDCDYDYDYIDGDEIDFDDDAELEALICVSKAKLKEANARWESAYEDIPSLDKEPEKVHFAETRLLTTVHKIIAWDFAYRAARLGPWEEMVRDRNRFRRRIEHMNRILSPVLQDQHRRKIWQKFHKETLNVP